MQTVAFCEINPYCRAVLRKHWPDVPIFEDVTKLCRRIYDCEPETEDGEVFCPRCETEFGDCSCIGTDQFTDEIGGIDVICGGFPCQDISLIGKRGGIEGEQSKLWFEYSRIIRELGPRWAIIENVSALVRSGLLVVLESLDACGYDAQWFCIPASAVGANHKRERVWIIAHSRSERLEGYSRNGKAKRKEKSDRSVASEDLLRGKNPSEWWKSEPGICRVVNGVPSYVDRTTALGNAVVPQIPEIIGRAIMLAEAEVHGK